MPTTKRISIAPRIVETITVDLAGKEYVVSLPKATLGLMMADKMRDAGDDAGSILTELHEWVVVCFGSKQGEKVWTRLMDPADETLDIGQVVDLVRQLTEAATPNPTT